MVTVKNLLFGDVEEFNLNELSVDDVSKEYIKTSILTLAKLSDNKDEFLSKFSQYYDLFSQQILDSISL